MTTFYDVFKPYFPDAFKATIDNNRVSPGDNLMDFSSINKDKEDFGRSSVSMLDTAYFVVAAIGVVILVYAVLLVTIGEALGVYGVVLATTLLFIAYALFLICRQKTNIFHQKSFLFVTTINRLYKEHIEASTIEAILEASKVRAALRPDNPFAQKLYMLEQEVNAQRPNFECYLSVKNWLKTEAKYLKLKDLVADVLK